jgi:Putative auto-transporter adhesin, head GIN domain
MKTKVSSVMIAALFFLISLAAHAETEERNLPAFTEISLRIPAKLYVQQGDVQKVTIDARAATLKDIVTEINGRTLVIKFPIRNYFWKNLDPGSIIIHITLKEISGLSLSGSGDIIAESTLTSPILNANISGSGNINLSDLKVDRMTAVISGSGNVNLKNSKVASEFSGTISGSGNIKAQNFEAEDVKVTISGSGNCSVASNGRCNVRIAGSGNFYYIGKPVIDSSIGGSGSVKQIK